MNIIQMIGLGLLNATLNIKIELLMNLIMLAEMKIVL